MQIVDAQIHLWQGGGAPPHHSLGGRTTHRYQEALDAMDTAGVNAAINCPPIWDANAHAYAAEAARTHPTRYATLDWFDLKAADPLAALEETLARPGVIGLRFLTESPAAIAHAKNVLASLTWPMDTSVDWLWEELVARDAPVTFYGGALLSQVRAIAARHPALKITIDHFGTIGNTTVDGKLVQMPDLLELSRLPNVAVKITAAPAYAIGAYPYVSIHPTIRSLYDHYGPRRLFWGTDITRLHASWRDCVTMFTEHMSFLSEEDLILIMGQAICDWHGWNREGG